MKKSQLRQLIKEIVSTILEDPDRLAMIDPQTDREKDLFFTDVEAAGKMGISVAQLPHLAGTFAETLNESTEEARFYWMDPNAKLVPVPRFGHVKWAEAFLKQNGYNPNDHDAYELMDKLRWYRVIFTEYMGKKIVSYDRSKDRPPSPRQLKAIKDLAIELGADEVEAQYF